MSFRDIAITTLRSLFFTPVIAGMLLIAQAQVMQSASYQIESDSINFGGGFSSSTNYVLESTGGEIATGESTSTNYGLKAGYQQMVNNLISISVVSPVVMTPSISGVIGGTANGSTTFTVTTDSAAGYLLSLRASVSPSMVNGANFISDYVPTGDPDYTFTFGSGQSYFGYSPSGVDTVARFKDDGVGTCNTGALETALACWDGLSTSDEAIAQSTGANTPDGATTTLYFRVGVGSGTAQAAGTYTATATLTAVSL